jgi:hypothetical protein
MRKESIGGAGVGQPMPSTGDGVSSRWERFLGWAEGLITPWGGFIRVLFDPYTFFLAVVGVLLGLFGPKAIGEGYNALLQIVIALVTGVVGARIATAMSALNQDGKLYSSGRMAVRGLRLILTRTLALERRVSVFAREAQKDVPAEIKAEIARRNLDEVLESIRALQTEIAGSIENWVDVVPAADVSAIFDAVADLRDQLSRKESELTDAVDSRTALENKGNADAASLRVAEDRIIDLEKEKASLESRINTLRSAAASSAADLRSIPRRFALEQYYLGGQQKDVLNSKYLPKKAIMAALKGVAPDVAVERHRLPD